MYRILVINFGSTSTKVSVFEDERQVVRRSADHLPAELRRFETPWDQTLFRKEAVLRILSEEGYSMKDFNAVASRGGNTRPVPGGIYVLNRDMLSDIKSGKFGIHPTGVGCEVAYELGQEYGIPALTADPPITDEFCESARFSGLKEYPRISSGHALNQKRTARIIASGQGRKYEEMNFVVTHMGGGISVGAHKKGRIIDMNNALDGEGPFSPERSGGIVVEDVLRICYEKGLTYKEARKYFRGGGGLVSYLGTNNGTEAESMMKNGDEYAASVLEAMAYQTGKEIGAMAAVLKGDVDAVALTGGLAHSGFLTGKIKEMVSYIAPVYIIPGENEMLALAESSLRYLRNEEEAKDYNEVKL